MLFISILIGILFAAVILIFSYEPKTLIQKRFSRTAPKKETFGQNMMTNFQEFLKPLSKKNAQTANFVSKTKKLLLQAGLASSEDDVIKYEARRLANMIFASIFCVLMVVIDFSTTTIIGCILFVYLVYKWPEMKLKKIIAERQKEFMKFLPDAVDLVSICVQAGLSLDAAFAKVAEEFELTSKTISVEFDRLNKDILSGLNRQEAYKNLVSRNENQELQSFVALLIQTDKLGTSISQSLESFCDSLRTKKRQKIEELSQQASTKMTIPMVLCMLPAIFIIILFPALQKIMLNLAK